METGVRPVTCGKETIQSDCDASLTNENKMTSDDNEVFMNVEDQLEDITKQISNLTNDEVQPDDIWQMKPRTMSEEGTRGTTTIARRPRSSRAITVCVTQLHAPANGEEEDPEPFNRLSQHSSGSSTSKSDELLESGVLKESSLKGLTAKNSYNKSASCSGNIPHVSNSKSSSVKNFVQSFEKLKDLSNQSNRTVHSPSDLFPAHRSALASKDSMTGHGYQQPNGKGNAVAQSHATIGFHVGSRDRSKTRDDRYFSLNAYQNGSNTQRSQDSAQNGQTGGTIQSRFLSNFKSNQRSSRSKETPPGDGGTLTRARVASVERKPERASGSAKDLIPTVNVQEKSKIERKGSAQLTRWTMTKHGRDLQKTNSVDSEDQSCGFTRPPVVSTSALYRATSLSKFDDNDEYLMSPPTTAALQAGLNGINVVKLSRDQSMFNPVSGYRPTFRSSNSGTTCSTRPDFSLSHNAVSGVGLVSGPVLSPSMSSGCGSSSPAVFRSFHGRGSINSERGGVGSVNGGSLYSSQYATLRLPTGQRKLNRTSNEAQPGELPNTTSQNTASDCSASASYNMADDIQASEIRRLRQDLQWAKEQVALLTSRLTNNANVVEAFDRSLASMSQRLLQLTATSQSKNEEIRELLDTVESLRRQNRGYSRVSHTGIAAETANSGCQVTSHLNKGPPSYDWMSRQMSSDSVTSLTGSAGSVCSGSTTTEDIQNGDSFGKKNTVKNWLRSSFGKAFSRKKVPQKSVAESGSSTSGTAPVLHANSMPSIAYSVPDAISIDSGCEEQNLHYYHPLYEPGNTSYYSSPYVSGSTPTCIQNSQASLSTNSLHKANPTDELLVNPTISPSGYGRPAPLHHKRSESLDPKLKLTHSTPLDHILFKERLDKDSHKIMVSVALSPETVFSKHNQEKKSAIVIGSVNVSNKTNWDVLDAMIRRVFQEHLIRLDPNTSLGLNGESVFSYNVGEINRTKGNPLPELLPIGYLIGEINTMVVNLRGNAEKSVDLLAFETLIPKSVIHRYLKLLLEHRRIILSGSTGTGKTYLAQKLAECLVLRSGSEITSDSIAVFRVDSQSSKELRQYLSNMADKCERKADRLPIVVILDNLHHVSSLCDVFSGFLDTNYNNCPYIIGTMNQATCSTTDLQLHHNFRWVLYANHIEPVRTFLGRYLRRQLVPVEVSSGRVNHDLTKVIEWLPKVWQHVNKFLETHSSCDITIGPRLFLSCPMDVNNAQIWFNDLWNYSIVPYLLEAVREGIQTYGCRAPWEDLADWVIDSYPWSKQTANPTLLRLRPEDVGYDNKTLSSSGDKQTASCQVVPTSYTTASEKSNEQENSLMEILARLHEAAVHSDSDTNSTDGHSQSERREDRHSTTPSLSDTASGSPPCRTTII